MLKRNAIPVWITSGFYTRSSSPSQHELWSLARPRGHHMPTLTAMAYFTEINIASKERVTASALVNLRDLTWLRNDSRRLAPESMTVSCSDRRLRST